ncbi:MAG: S8 family serine peptidase [Bacteroidota bacterium]
MRSLRLFIFASFALAAASVSAQITTDLQGLRRASEGYKLQYDANFSKALNLSKEKGWPLTMKEKDGGLAMLTGVDQFGLPIYYTTYSNVLAATTTRANQLWPGGASGFNLTGSSAFLKDKLGIWDGGRLLATHVELSGRIIQKDNPTGTDDHGTHVAGTMIASGVNPVAKGMSYGAQNLLAYDFSNDASEMFAQATESSLLLSNHSYGSIAGWRFNSSQSRWEFWGRFGDNEDANFGYYNSQAQAWDSLAYLTPNYLIVKSAGNNRSVNGPAIGQPYFRFNSSGNMASAGNRPDGISSNDGYDIISTSGNAKNILTVGAISGIPGGYSRPSDVLISSFSSWGPTDDGRIKPDIVAQGVDVTSPIATTNTSYASINGTSMSSPNVTGSLFLLQELYGKLKSGAAMRSATLKGIAIHTADEAGFSPGPDYQHGWGLLNVERGAALINDAVTSNNASTSNHLLYENNLTNGASFTINVVASGKGPLRATICWTDPRGNVETVDILNNRSKKLVNDLDIRITKTNGFGTYLPWTLEPNFPASPAFPADNSIDNVERIDVDSTVPGQAYTIRVSHKGVLVKDAQAYSLLVSGVGGTAFCNSTSGGGGARIDSVIFSNLRVANPAGSRTYTDYTRFTATVEPLQTLPISIKLNTADASANSRIVKVFIDFNNNGTFDTGELMATSNALTSAEQVYTANIAIPATVSVGNLYLMRIVVQETNTAADVQACGTYGRGETQDYRLRVVSASNDVMPFEITAPASGDCEGAQNYLTIKIKNNGSVTQSNIPVSGIVTTTGGAIVSTFSTVYRGNILAGSTATVTFQNPFAMLPGSTYNILAATSLSNDQNSNNNNLVSSFATTARPSAPVGTGSMCGNNAFLRVTNPDPGANYFWYNSESATAPVTSGFNASTSNVPANRTFYLGKEIQTSIGPATKLAYTNGGYNTFSGNFVRINNSVPLVIKTARMYIGNPGKIRVIYGDLTNETPTGYNYIQRYSTIIDVPATNPNPQPGLVNGNNPQDTGAVFRLDIPVLQQGEHILILQCLSGDGRLDSASIFRNNQISTPDTYPISIPGVMSITGNSVTPGTSQPWQFYYFFYDMKISTLDCPSARVAVSVASPVEPVITRQGDSLVSSYNSANQWYVNDTLIVGANAKTFKPTRSGNYKVIVFDSFGCQLTSNTINVTITALTEQLAEEIKLRVSPNPNKGRFNLSFTVDTRADLWIDIIDPGGNKAFSANQANFIGNYSKEISLPQLSSSMYLLRIQHNKKVYIKKLVIQR